MSENYEKALKLVRETNEPIGPSLLQRRLVIGYTKAARLIDELEENGVISGYEGAKPRRLLKP